MAVENGDFSGGHLGAPVGDGMEPELASFAWRKAHMR